MMRRQAARWWTLAAGAAGLALALAGSGLGDDLTAVTGSPDPATPAAQPAPKDPKADPPRTTQPAKTPPDVYSVDEVLDVLRDTNPDLEKRIRAAKENAPDKVEAMIRGVMPKIKPILDVKHKDKEMYQLVLQDLKTTRLCEEQTRIARTSKDPAEVDTAKAQLRVLLHQRFGIRQKMRELELHRKVHDLEQQVADRAKHENDDVDADYARMLGLPKPKPAETRPAEIKAPDKKDGAPTDH